MFDWLFDRYSRIFHCRQWAMVDGHPHICWRYRWHRGDHRGLEQRIPGPTWKRAGRQRQHD